MSGENKNGIDWQAELKARLEAYEKRTGRKISGKKPDQDPDEIGEQAPDDSVAGKEDSPEGSEASSPSRAQAPPSEPDEEETVPFDDSASPEEEYEYPAGPDFLAILDGVDDEDDEDEFLFKERLSRDTDPDEELFDSPAEDESAGREDSYFGDFEEETPESGSEAELPDDPLIDDPLVKVVNIDEFRMDSSVEEVMVPLEENLPPLLEPEEDQSDEEVSKEIIVSRLLGGTLDLVLAVIVAAGFMEVAAWKLSLDFFDIGILKWIGGLAVVFYFLNCLYFLTLIRRTPGMLLTELRLISSRKGQEVSFFVVLIRTLAFFPSALSVTGLVWAFFDFQARCLHDIVSGTRVVSNKGGR